MAKKALLADVVARVHNNKPGFRTWFERLPEEARDELDAVRKAFDPTVHQKCAYARAIIEAATDRGWKVGGVQAVVAWLDEKR